MVDLIEIYVHWYAGRSQVQIAQSLGVDRKTVRKYLAPVAAAGLTAGDPGLVPVAIERGEGLVVGLIARAGHPVLMVEPAAFKPRVRGGAQPARSPTPRMRSCSPTTPEPMATGCARWNPWHRQRGSSPPWSGHGPPWSRHAPRRPTSCGPSSPSTRQALRWSFRG